MNLFSEGSSSSQKGLKPAHGKWCQESALNLQSPSEIFLNVNVSACVCVNMCLQNPINFRTPVIDVNESPEDIDCVQGSPDP